MKTGVPWFDIATGGLGAYSEARRAIRDWSTTYPSTLVKDLFGNKRKGPSKTVTMLPEKGETKWFSNEYSKNTRSLGRKFRHNVRQAWKRISAGTVHTVYAFRAYSQWGGTQGTNRLNNTNNGAATLTVPCHLYDVTAAVNFSGTPAATLVTPNIRWDPQFTLPSAAGVLTWSNTAALAVENSPAGANITTNLPGPQSILDWVQAKFLFYAPTTRPTRILIQLVQFTDERCVPGATVSDFSTAFWQSLTKKFGYSPLEAGDNRYRKYLKVLYSQSFGMDPKDNTEPVNTRLREIHIFKRMNRAMRYAWIDNDKMAMDAQDGQQNLGQSNTIVHPRARIFLMIRALAANAIAETLTLHPSYDFVLRTKHSIAT